MSIIKNEDLVAKEKLQDIVALNTRSKEQEKALNYAVAWASYMQDAMETEGFNVEHHSYCANVEAESQMGSTRNIKSTHNWAMDILLKVWQHRDKLQDWQDDNLISQDFKEVLIIPNVSSNSVYSMENVLS